MRALAVLLLLACACRLPRVDKCGAITLGQKARTLALGSEDAPWRCHPLAARTPPPSSSIYHFPTTVSVDAGPLSDFECCCDVAAGATHGCNVACNAADFANVRPRQVEDPDFSQVSAGDRGADDKDLGWCFVWVRGEDVVGRFFLAN